jgi:hypothetical protein
MEKRNAKETIIVLTPGRVHAWLHLINVSGELAFS